MKTNQFIKEIKSMGLQVKGLGSEVIIRDSEGYNVAVTSKVEFAMLETDYRAFYELDYNTRLQLINLLFNYATTPIEEREEEKKYYYKLRGFGDNEYYLNLDLEDDVPSEFIGGYYQTKYYQTQFTDAEFEALPDDIKSHNWEKIKVERDNH